MEDYKKKGIEELGISEELYDEILGDFIKQSDEYLKDIKNALDNEDLEAAGKTAHTIKGSSGNLRLAKIQQIALAVELAVKEKKDINVARQEFEKLKIAVGEIKKQEGIS